jgi:hypothetical protein
MERPTRLFINPKSVSHYLMCIICDDIFDDPARLPCGHTFCRSCIEAWTTKTKQCPVCRTRFTINKISRDLVAANIVGELEVMCRHRGCQWRGELNNLEGHEAQCKFHPDQVESWLVDSLPSKAYNDEDGVSMSGSSLISSLYEKLGASALSVVKERTIVKAKLSPKVLFMEDLSDQEP